MTHLSYADVTSSLRQVIEIGFTTLFRKLIPFRSGRRLTRRQRAALIPHRQQQHFGSLDDQLLNDLGLQRSEIRAAEFGILPGDQALHHEDSMSADRAPETQSRI